MPVSQPKDLEWQNQMSFGEELSFSESPIQDVGDSNLLQIRRKLKVEDDDSNSIAEMSEQADPSVSLKNNTGPSTSTTDENRTLTHLTSTQDSMPIGDGKKMLENNDG